MIIPTAGKKLQLITENCVHAREIYDLIRRSIMVAAGEA